MCHSICEITFRCRIAVRRFQVIPLVSKASAAYIKSIPLALADGEAHHRSLVVAVLRLVAGTSRGGCKALGSMPSLSDARLGIKCCTQPAVPAQGDYISAPVPDPAPFLGQSVSRQAWKAECCRRRRRCKGGTVHVRSPILAGEVCGTMGLCISDVKIGEHLRMTRLPSEFGHVSFTSKARWCATVNHAALQVLHLDYLQLEGSMVVQENSLWESLAKLPISERLKVSIGGAAAFRRRHPLGFQTLSQMTQLGEVSLR